MVRAAVVHWDPDTLADKAEAVQGAGGEVVLREGMDARRALQGILDHAPDVVVAWLTWKPNHTRILAAAIRSKPWGRRLPLLLLDDPAFPTPPATLREIRQAIPDALVDRPERLAFWLQRIGAQANHATRGAENL